MTMMSPRAVVNDFRQAGHHGNADHCVYNPPFFNSVAGFTSGSVRLMTRSRLKSQYQPRVKVNSKNESQMSQERMIGILRANNGTGKLDSRRPDKGQILIPTGCPSPAPQTLLRIH